HDFVARPDRDSQVGGLLCCVVFVVCRVAVLGAAGFRLVGGGELVGPFHAVRGGVAEGERAVRVAGAPLGGGTHHEPVEVALPGVGAGPHGFPGLVHHGAGHPVAGAGAHFEDVCAVPVLGEPFDVGFPLPQDCAVGRVLQQVPFFAVGADEEGVANRVDAHPQRVAEDVPAG